MSRHVLIAGGGIGGLTAALALAQTGVAVSILERAASLDAIGAGLQISPNASKILRDLGLIDAVEAIATRPSGIRIRAARSGGTLALIPLKDAERRWGAPYLVAHRADLQAVLHAAVIREPTIALHLGTTLAGFGVRPDRVAVTVKQGQLRQILQTSAPRPSLRAERHNDGPVASGQNSALTRTYEGDALIGADGIRSIVRATLTDGDDPPLETGRTAWRAIIPADAVDALFSNGETGLWLGRHAHLVHYPLRGGTQVNVVAITRDTSEADPTSPWAAEGDPARIAARFARWHPAARGLIAAAGAWTTWPLFDRRPLPAWAIGRIALLGDAAHPILPFFAQGAAQAIEDAAALASSIAATPDVASGLAAYSAERLPRATRVQAASRQLGRVYHMTGPAALARDTAMRVLGPERLLARYDWLYDMRR